MGKYRIWCPDRDKHEENGTIVEQSCAPAAAEKWAEMEDWYSADFVIVGGQTVEVTVRDLTTGEQSEWTVSGESVPHYFARRKP